MAHYTLVEISGLKVWTPGRYHLLISTTLKAIQDHNPELFSLITDRIAFIYSSPANLDLGFVDKALILNNGYDTDDDGIWKNPGRVWCQLGRQGDSQPGGVSRQAQGSVPGFKSKAGGLSVWARGNLLAV
ncbi:MAG: hypothetical protein EOP86_25190 [Verrucomicrobiaceae bacterium]|nr:MAG: hypothetical protein EOP86_25190 [Verrucomicrobiaceae bacterium]